MEDVDVRRIVKYLLINHGKLEKCTLRHMERELGISYSRLRRIMGYLENEDIVRRVIRGKTKPYVLSNISKAMNMGLIEFSGREIESIVMMSMASLNSFCREVNLNMSSISIGNGCDIVEQVGKVFGEISTKLIKGESVAFSSRVCGVSSLPLFFLPVIRTSLFPICKEIEIEIKRFLGYNETLEVTPLWIGLLVREVFFEMGCPEEYSEEDIRRAIVSVLEKQLRLLINMFKPLADGGAKIRAMCLDLMSLVYAAIVVSAVGGSRELVKEALDLYGRLIN